MTNLIQIAPLAHVVKKIMMMIGTLLFVLLSVHTFTVAGSPNAAHMTHDVQPEIHAPMLTNR